MINHSPWLWLTRLIFFNRLTALVITQRVKYRKKVPLGTGTEFGTGSNVNGTQPYL